MGSKELQITRGPPARPPSQILHSFELSPIHHSNKQLSQATASYSHSPLMQSATHSVLHFGLCTTSLSPQLCFHGRANAIQTASGFQRNIVKFQLLQQTAVSSRRGIGNVRERTNPCQPAQSSNMRLDFCKNLCHHIDCMVLWWTLHQAKFRSFAVNIKKAHAFGKDVFPQRVSKQSAQRLCLKTNLFFLQFSNKFRCDSESWHEKNSFKPFALSTSTPPSPQIRSLDSLS